MAISIISETMREALLNQWVEEKENSHTYLYIGAWMKNKGLDNLGKYFMDASKEEDGHAQSIVDLLTDLNVAFEPRILTNMTFTISSILDIAEKFVDREVQTTQSLQSIKQIAIEEDELSSIVEEHMRKMIHQQQSEMEECLTFMDKSLLFKEWWQVALWDLSLK